MFYVRLFCVKTVFFGKWYFNTLWNYKRKIWRCRHFKWSDGRFATKIYIYHTKSNVKHDLTKARLRFFYFISILKSRMVKPKKKSCFWFKIKKKENWMYFNEDIYLYNHHTKKTFLRKQKCVCVLKVFKTNFVFVT